MISAGGWRMNIDQKNLNNAIDHLDRSGKLNPDGFNAIHDRHAGGKLPQAALETDRCKDMSGNGGAR